MTTTRTVNLDNDSAEIKPVANGRLSIHTASGVEVMRPPTGSVRLSGTRGKRGTLTFGNVSKSVLLINGDYNRLAHLFEVLTGVTP